MENARKQLQVIRLALSASIVLYAGIIWRTPSSATPTPLVFSVITVVAISMVVIAFVMRKKQIVPAEAALGTKPSDKKELARWRQGFIVTYALYEAIALYGLVLHFLGYSFSQVLPFLAVGLGMMLFYGPKAGSAREFPPDSGRVP